LKKELFKCSNCSQKIEASKIVVFDGKVECYSCWEKGIDKFKVKELRDKLIPYLEIDRSELKKTRKIIEENYFGENDERSKEILMVLSWISEDKRGISPSAYLKKIDLEIKKLEPTPEPEPQLKKYTQKCPNCEKTFSCEVEESDTSEKEANANLSEQIGKHVKEVHEKNEAEEEKKTF